MARLVLLSMLAGCGADGPTRSQGDPALVGGGAAGTSAAPTAGAFSAVAGNSAADAAVSGTAGGAAQAADGSVAADPSDAADGGGAVHDSGVSVPSSPGYLHTRGRELVDEDGHVVRLTGLSWFGMETSNYAPHGLWTRSLESMLDQVVALGYNMLRLPFCTQMLDPGVVPTGIDFSKNPGLQGLSGVTLLDAIVDAAGARGLRVVLDRHRPDSNAQSELWYTSQYGEERWIEDWEMLAARYQGNPTVIGFDLHNEPRGPATWGDGNMATDWRLAAERAGNAVLAINSDLLIIVEGVESYAGSATWWGGNLRGAANAPVRLQVKDRVVYSVHEYPPSVYMQPWFSAPDYPANLPAIWHDNWGYLVENDVAPVWVGEFGTKLETPADKAWLAEFAEYIGAHQLGFAYWCLNPNSGDTGGILKDDWMTVNQDKQAVLAPLLAPLIE